MGAGDEPEFEHFLRRLEAHLEVLIAEERDVDACSLGNGVGGLLEAGDVFAGHLRARSRPRRWLRSMPPRGDSFHEHCGGFREITIRIGIYLCP